MMKKPIIYITFIIFLFLYTNTAFCVNIKKNYSTGLIFRSHEVNKDERTSLILTPNRSLKSSGYLNLEFDLKLRYAHHSYGYVFRIIANDTASLDMTSDMGPNKINVILNNKKGTQATSELSFDRKQMDNQWIKVTIEINKDSIKYSINGEEKMMSKSFTSPKEWKIFFGANKHEYFYTSDVPPMSIRNIIIRDKKEKVIRNWSMAMHGKDIVYDNIGNHPAKALNSVWEIDKHIKWEKKISLTTKQKTPQIAYDSINARVFTALKDSLYVINIKRKSIKRYKVEEGKPFDGASSQLIYDHKNKQLISYNIDHPQFLAYDFTTNKWSGYSDDRALRIQHHNRFIDEKNNQLVVFGGYGFYKYNATLATHNLFADNWEKTDLIDQITPRYLASLGYLQNGKILIFGGYGSATGIQQESSRNLYDLYEIDTRNKSSIKLGELSDVQSHLTFSNSMVINRPEQTFYTLSYNNDKYKTFINLLEVDMKTMNHRLLADSIPYNFHDIESYCDLFLYKDSELYAIVSQKLENELYNVSIYSLMYPPLAKNDILQDNLAKKETKWLTIIIITLFIAILCIGGYLFIQKARRNSKIKDKQHSEANPPELHFIEPEQTYPNRQTFSSISLLGGFQVFDYKGKDITSHFTPIIRQLFLMILLESITSGKGVTSERLDDTFWFDMDRTKATNNRNVNISKLRLLLQDVGEIKLQKNGNYWQINMNDDVFCDFDQIIKIIHKIKKADTIDQSSVEYLISIASSGVLLPNIDAEWSDKYKSDYSSSLIEILLEFSRQENIQNEHRLLIKLADTILLHDNIDEDSIRIKCRCLYKLGQKGLSKQCYDKFHADYKNILNEEPTLKYEDIIN